MGNRDQTFQDAELVAFVDRRLPEARRRAIAECASKDSVLAERIALLTDGSPSLEATFRDDLTNVPPAVISKVEALAAYKQGSLVDSSNIVPITVQKQLTLAVSRRRWLTVASAMAASFAAGMVGGKFLVGIEKTDQGIAGKLNENDWREAVAQYHALYGRQTIERLSPTNDEQMNELAIVSKALGHQLGGIDRSTPGYIYLRSQLLEFEGAPLVQIVFEAPDKIPIAFCLKRQRISARSAKVEIENRLGMPLAYWSRDGIDQLVVGRISAESIIKLADRLVERG
jgi:anti-sigma factor RsiW